MDEAKVYIRVVMADDYQAPGRPKPFQLSCVDVDCPSVKIINAQAQALRFPLRERRAKR
ncbi:hypothetical protein [Streptomyces sp. NPDC056227]|uniref:hypothetical protein n=1 Tax=Streptomyces sp. NPDC056227 TaxID=3345753 RepID=UPI0035E34E28